MRFSARRLGASSFLAGILLAGGIVAPAGAATYSTTLTQSAPTPLRAGSLQSVTATVTADGAPVADGTLVSFGVRRDPGEFVVGKDDIFTSNGIGNAVNRPQNDGYWLVDATGNVFAYGKAPALGGLADQYDVFGWVIGVAPTQTGNGYWLATIDGKVYPFGDAPQGVIDYGPLAEGDWAVDLVPAAGPLGYRLVTARGRTLPGSVALDNPTVMGPLFDDAPVLGARSTPTGLGYYVYNGLGHVAAFGDATMFGDLHTLKLTQTITALAPTPTGHGYWLLGDDGSLYVFGDATFSGNAQPFDPDGFYTGILPGVGGYRLVTYEGQVYPFGGASMYGSLWNVPTKGGKATFSYTSLAPGSTTVVASGPPSMSGGNTFSMITTVWTPADGYWMLSADGTVYPFGGAVNLGDAKPYLGGHQAVDLEPTPDYGGYWIVDDIGRVFSFGNAKATLGNVDTGALRAGEKVTSLSATPTGAGYWIFTSLGRVFAKGDATHFGDMSGTPLNGPVLDSIPTPTGQGYYMVGSDGGIFAFGDAEFAGSMGNQKLNAPVQSLVPDPDGAGYWLVASDGGIFAFDAEFHGSMGDTKLNKPVTGMVAFGDAYLMVGEDGGIFNFSDRPFYGSLGAHPPASPIVSVAILDPFS